MLQRGQNVDYILLNITKYYNVAHTLMNIPSDVYTLVNNTHASIPNII